MYYIKSRHSCRFAWQTIKAILIWLKYFNYSCRDYLKQSNNSGTKIMLNVRIWVTKCINMGIRFLEVSNCTHFPHLKFIKKLKKNPFCLDVYSTWVSKKERLYFKAIFRRELSFYHTRETSIKNKRTEAENFPLKSLI